MKIYTIGFAKKNATTFFGILKKAGIRRLIDIRLYNVSQLAGFTKRDDLAFFVREICGADYVHELLLAPTAELLDAVKKGGSWAEYETGFCKLITERKIETAVDRHLFDVPAVLLCSEPTADQCHRRLVAEHLRDKWGDVEIVHL